MRTIQVGDLKTHFSEVLKEVKKGEEIIISFGRKKEKIAIIVPYDDYQKRKTRKLGLLEGKASFKIQSNFEMSEEELLSP